MVLPVLLPCPLVTLLLTCVVLAGWFDPRTEGSLRANEWGSSSSLHSGYYALALLYALH